MSVTLTDAIARDLISKAKQASRLPDTHKDKVHAEINDLLYDWEIARRAQFEVPC